MKAYKLEVLVVDFENLGAEAIQMELERSRYLMPNIMSVDSREIGEWSDDHLLNHTDTMPDEFKRLFANKISGGGIRWAMKIHLLRLSQLRLRCHYN